MHIETAGTAWSGLPDEEGPWEVLRGVFVNAIIEYFQPCSYIFRKMVFIFFAGYSMKEPSISTMHLLYR
jgi:hypothetical protein